jgi:hypothetical protein
MDCQKQLEHLLSDAENYCLEHSILNCSDVKQKLRKNAVRLELAHKELDATIQEFNALFKEYQTNANHQSKAGDEKQPKNNVLT